MIKVLIITYYWPPSGGAGVQRWLKFAKYLPEFGWKPIVLSVDEDFASYPQIDKSLVEEVSSIDVFKTKSFELYNLYSGIKKDSQIPYGGFSNEDKPGFIQKAARFVRGNFFLPDPRKGWNKYAYKKAVELIKKYNISNIITTSPPHSTQLIGVKLKKRFPNINWIADLRDPWTDIYYYEKFYPTFISKSIDRNYEQKVIQNADKVFVVSQSLRQIYNQRYNVGDKIEVVTNGFDEMDFVNKNSSIKIAQNEILYTGTITDDYPLEELLVLIKKLSDSKFRFIGNVPESFQNLVSNSDLKSRVRFEKSIPHNEIVKEMQSAGALLLLIPKVKNNEGIITGKIFEYLASSRPIIGIGPKNGDAERLIKETETGIYLDYSSVENFKFNLLDELSSKTGNKKVSSYSRKEIAKSVSQFLK